jgi:hypothetical protein
MANPAEVPPPLGPKKYWTRKGVANWLRDVVSHESRVLVGIDHGFSFPLKYFERHRLPPSWPLFLEDFVEHWPTHEDHLYVDFVRDGVAGNGAARTGEARWKRLTESRTGHAKSVFHFDVQGQVAKSTHAGLPWLLFLRRALGSRVHFWPFDGWDIPEGLNAIVEVYPRLCGAGILTQGLTGDQRDAYSVAMWLRNRDHAEDLTLYLHPPLTKKEKAVAMIEGWILGVS